MYRFKKEKFDKIKLNQSKIAEEAPTAAKASGPRKRPTIMTSAVL